MKNNKYEINIKEEYIHIINYIDIEDMKETQIKIQLKNKYIIINGEKLLITSLSEEEMLIKGIVKGINFISE